VKDNRRCAVFRANVLGLMEYDPTWRFVRARHRPFFEYPGKYSKASGVEYAQHRMCRLGKGRGWHRPDSPL